MAQNKNQHSDPGQRGRRDARDEHKIATAIQTLKGSFESANTQQAEHNDKSFPWVRRTGKAAVVYTVLTFLLLAASGYTAYEATIASGAATRQAAVAEDTEKRQLRAYIGLIPPPDNQIINNFTPPTKPTVHLTPKNFGLTPAYEARHETGSGVFVYPLPKSFLYPIQKAATPPNPITIFPGNFDIAGINTNWTRALSSDEIASIQDDRAERLYFWGTVSYRDAFGDPHYTNFCISFYALTSTETQREPCPDHNDSD
jgi:hypothetical protein